MSNLTIYEQADCNGSENSKVVKTLRLFFPLVRQIKKGKRKVCVSTPTPSAASFCFIFLFFEKAYHTKLQGTLGDRPPSLWVSKIIGTEVLHRAGDVLTSTNWHVLHV